VTQFSPTKGSLPTHDVRSGLGDDNNISAKIADSCFSRPRVRFSPLLSTQSHTVFLVASSSASRPPRRSGQRRVCGSAVQGCGCDVPTTDSLAPSSRPDRPPDDAKKRREECFEGFDRERRVAGRFPARSPVCVYTFHPKPNLERANLFLSDCGNGLFICPGLRRVRSVFDNIDRSQEV